MPDNWRLRLTVISAACPRRSHRVPAPAPCRAGSRRITAASIAHAPLVGVPRILADLQLQVASGGLRNSATQTHRSAVRRGAGFILDLLPNPGLIRPHAPAPLRLGGGGRTRRCDEVIVRCARLARLEVVLDCAVLERAVGCGGAQVSAGRPRSSTARATVGARRPRTRSCGEGDAAQVGVLLAHLRYDAEAAWSASSATRPPGTRTTGTGEFERSWRRASPGRPARPARPRSNPRPGRRRRPTRRPPAPPPTLAVGDHSVELPRHRRPSGDVLRAAGRAVLDLAPPLH